MDWLYSHAVGGVSVMVPKDYVVRAQTLLNTDHSAALREALQLSEQEWQQLDAYCPYCPQQKLQAASQRWRIAFALFFFLNLPSPFQHGLRCPQCGYFKADQS
ncbi:hypothetical protein [Acinetobacter larvae]|uniref:hypothetical protein n=1 Tax=Acinetobacter larvae TaxID=1789224 RepID=UPI0009D77C4A|nr:hypothetical protein [Acinetobacter larvae]